MAYILKYLSVAWIVLSITVFGLLATVPYTHSARSPEFIARTYGWPGGWLTSNKYKSGKTTPPGKYRLDIYVSNRTSYGIAWGVAVLAPGLILLPLWMRSKRNTIGN